MRRSWPNTRRQPARVLRLNSNSLSPTRRKQVQRLLAPRRACRNPWKSKSWKRPRLSNHTSKHWHSTRRSLHHNLRLTRESLQRTRRQQARVWRLTRKLLKATRQKLPRALRLNSKQVLEKDKKATAKQIESHKKEVETTSKLAGQEEKSLRSLR